MTTEMLRPKAAASRFGVHRVTLHEWAEKGLIGRSRVGGCVFYRASDIAEAIAANETRRTVLPMVSTPAALPPAANWRDDPLWSTPTAAREAAR